MLFERSREISHGDIALAGCVEGTGKAGREDRAETHQERTDDDPSLIRGV